MSHPHRLVWPLALALLMAACGAPPPQNISIPKEADNMTEAATSLGVIDLKPGSGVEIKPGQKAVVHYTGWLFAAAAPENKGMKFDSSRDHGAPFEFNLGLGEVIRGWDQGVTGMKVGEQRRLIVPASLGYGAAGAGGVIPGGATLVFDVELLAIH